jgi:hypothetical protein
MLRNDLQELSKEFINQKKSKMSYDNTNTAVIFKNNKKENEKHPDYRGTINVDGKELEISLWIKEGKAGKFFSAVRFKNHLKRWKILLIRLETKVLDYLFNHKFLLYLHNSSPLAL